jgi:hypothetical protein
VLSGILTPWALVATVKFDNRLFAPASIVKKSNEIGVTLRVTPAMESGIADHIWTLEKSLT